MTKQQILEEKLRKMIKTQLLKEEMTKIFTIVKTFNNSHPRDIAVYFDLQKANKICQILQQNAADEDYSEEINYKVVPGTAASPARKN